MRFDFAKYDRHAGAAAHCSLSDIVVTQAGTGGWAHRQPEYAVTGEKHSSVTVACDGFNTTLEVDPAKLRYDGSGKPCLLNNGAAVVQGADLIFSYAWSTQFTFQPLSSTVIASAWVLITGSARIPPVTPVRLQAWRPDLPAAACALFPSVLVHLCKFTCPPEPCCWLLRLV
ncbi:hypothetical protein BRADI_4g17611v3 [Brachypodium distachyon]|uniref:Uncharacterized protein n=1 Tax=Brachypodium distachyon TaxID=15368 RepID=A0A2K2CNJ2_BRADI|nr:hypothetical protein BRADI_4g17611v3 [Brachypodium distachyon]